MEKNIEIYKIGKKILLNNEIIAFNTDTVMGFGVNGRSLVAVKKLFDLKNRSYDKPLYLLSYSISQILDYVELIPHYAYDLMERYFPGALTLILKSNGKLYTMPGKKGDTLGVRIPNHPSLLDFLSYIKIPLLNTSANITGKKPFITEKDVLNVFGDRVFFLKFEYNIQMSNAPSTIIDCTGEEPRIIRKGVIKL